MLVLINVVVIHYHHQLANLPTKHPGKLTRTASGITIMSRLPPTHIPKIPFLVGSAMAYLVGCTTDYLPLHIWWIEIKSHSGAELGKTLWVKSSFIV